MDEGARKWMLKTAHKEHWRIASWYDLEDLIQEGYVCYYKVRERYPDATDRPHIMCLFQRTFTNRLHDLAKRKTRLTEVVMSDFPSSQFIDNFWDSLLPVDDEIATLYTLINQVTNETKAVLNLLTSEAGRKSLRAVYRVKLGGHRETFNERLCRLTGYDATKTDMITTTRSMLSMT